MYRSKIVYIDLRKVIIKIIFAVAVVSLFFTYRWWNEVYLIRFEAPEWASSYQVTEPEFTKQFSKLVSKAEKSASPKPNQPYFTFTMTSRRTTKTYIFSSDLNIYDIQQKATLKTNKELKKILQNIKKILKNRSPYGDLLNWDTINPTFSLDETIKVRDMETGKTFRVVRKAGFSLARVLPVSDTDKLLIQEIFGGKWSWKRRAVIVYLQEKRIAACLVGMPQGKEQLFSLYFYSNAANKHNSLANKITIFKAAGKLKEMYRDTTPEESILGALTAIDQRDETVLNLLMTSPVKKNLLEEANIVGLTLKNLNKKTENTYKALVSVTFAKGPYNHWRSVQITLKYNKALRFYQLEPSFLKALLKN